MDATSKQCPLCGEWILRVAVRCKHCHADLHAYQVAEGQAAPTTGTAGASAPRGLTGLAGTPPQGSALTGASASTSAASASDSTTGGAAPPSTGESSRREYVAPREGDFEQRFLDFAFKTSLPISAVTVAYALKIPIKEAADGLEDLAARDVLLREVDEHGGVTFQLPGRQQIAAEIVPIGQMGQIGPGTALSPYSQPPPMLYEPSVALTRTPPESTALAGLLVNVLLLPGLGSLIGGKTNAGIFQLLMFLLGFPLCLSVIGLVIGGPMMMGAWIWGLVSGVNMLSEAKAAASQQRQLAG